MTYDEFNRLLLGVVFLGRNALRPASLVRAGISGILKRILFPSAEVTDMIMRITVSEGCRASGGTFLVSCVINTKKNPDRNR